MFRKHHRLQEAVALRIFGIRQFQNLLGTSAHRDLFISGVYFLLFHFEPLKLDQTYPQNPEFPALTRFGSEILEIMKIHWKS